MRSSITRLSRVASVKRWVFSGNTFGMIQLKDIVGKTIRNIYEWREYEANGIDMGSIYILLDDEDMDRCIIGIPHFEHELYPEFRIDRVLDTRAKSVFSKRKKIFRTPTPLAKKLKGQTIKHIYFDHERGYYELENGYIISENMALPHGLNAAGLIMFDSIEQLMALDDEKTMQRLTV